MAEKSATYCRKFPVNHLLKGFDLMRRFNLVPAILAATMLSASLVAPAQALKPPPKDTPPTGSSGSSGGTEVPEPSSVLLFGAGAAAFMMAKRRKQTRD